MKWAAGSNELGIPGVGRWELGIGEFGFPNAQRPTPNADPSSAFPNKYSTTSSEPFAEGE
jgi:hypothetical protein